MKLLKFSASWCGPCKQLQTYIDNNPSEFPIDILYVLVDGGGDVEQQLTSKFKIKAVPTCVLVDNAENELGRVTGFKPDALKDLVDLYDGTLAGT